MCIQQFFLITPAFSSDPTCLLPKNERKLHVHLILFSKCTCIPPYPSLLCHPKTSSLKSFLKRLGHYYAQLPARGLSWGLSVLSSSIRLLAAVLTIECFTHGLYSLIFLFIQAMMKNPPAGVSFATGGSSVCFFILLLFLLYSAQIERLS